MIVYFEQFFLEITNVAHIFGLLFHTDEVINALTWQKMYWATFWVDFSQAPLVNLEHTYM
jgi:hypothetical protein